MCNTGAGSQVEVTLLHQLVVGEDDIAQGGEQMAAYAGDHPAVDEGRRRRVEQLQLDAARLGDHPQIEVGVARIDFPRIVDFSPGVEHRQRTAAEQLVDILARRCQARHLPPGQQVQALHRSHGGEWHLLDHAINYTPW